jgi:hypothetical protein
MAKAKPYLKGLSPFPGSSSVVFFGSPPYLLRIDVLGEAGHVPSARRRTITHGSPPSRSSV